MSEQRKRGRPRKTTPKAMSEQPDHTAEIERYQEALAKAQRELDALRLMNKYADKPVVVVRHSGHGPQLAIKIEGEENSVLLDPFGGSSKATIPLTDYLNLKKHTDWVEKGYLYAEEQPDTDNPNLILDIDKWFKSKSEKSMLAQVAVITSDGLLNALYAFTEDLEKTSKVLVLRNAVARKLEEIFDITVAEDLSMDRKSGV